FVLRQPFPFTAHMTRHAIVTALTVNARLRGARALNLIQSSHEEAYPLEQWQQTLQSILSELDDGQYEQALKHLAEVESLAADHPDRLAQLAELYFDLGHQGAAERMAEKALELEEEMTVALLIK